MTLARKLKCIRLANGLTQDEMADIFFTTQGNYSQYETGHRQVSVDMLILLIEKFKIDANWLLQSNNSSPAINNREGANDDIKYYNIDRPDHMKLLINLSEKIDFICHNLRTTEQ